MSGFPAPFPTTAVHVLVAEPAPLLRDGLARLLGRHPEMEVVAQAASGEEALRLTRRLAPDVLLADIRLLGDGAPGAPVRVVALTEEHDDETLRRRVHDLLEAGVSSVVSTKDNVETLFEAIRAGADGEVWVSPRIAARLGSRSSDAAEEAGLTPRQRELLCRVAAGQPSARIAAEMYLAPGTLRNHLSAIYARLGVKSRSEAVAWAWRVGLVVPEADDGPVEAPSENDMRHPKS